MKDQDLFRDIFEKISNGVAICDLITNDLGEPIDYIFLKVNQAFEDITLLKADETVGKTVKEIYPDVEPFWIQRFGTVVNTGKDSNFSQYNHNTNKHYGVNAFSLSGKRFVMVLQDITQEKINKEELEKSEKNYKYIFDSMFEMFQVIELVYDAKGKVIDYIYLQVNPALEKLVNKKKSELIGFRVRELFGIVEDHWMKAYEEIDKTGKAQGFENYAAEVDQYFKVNAWKVEDGVVAVAFRDVTDEKKYETEILKSKEKAEESDRLKSAFLANMSHEIRTPMNGILGFTNLLKTHNLSGEDQKKYIHIIEQSGERMLNIINDIISISKIESGLMELNLQRSNINEQLNYIYSFFKPEMEAKGIQFAVKNDLTLEEATIKTDREKLFAILTNLVKNALKFTENGRVEFGCKSVKDHLQFYVKDTGIGISQDRQKAIFKRFVQADISDKRAFQGAGLGLSISKAYVELLNGKMWVESELGIGSIFYFTIPFQNKVKSKIKDEQNVIEQKSASEIKNLKILIAEDDDISALLMKTILNDISGEIIRVTNGIKALESCKNNPNIDLIFMDINMPKMGGYEAIQEIRKFNKEVVIIMQTANSLTGDKEKAIQAGCNEYLPKPILKHELIAIIEPYFSKSV